MSQNATGGTLENSTIPYAIRSYMKFSLPKNFFTEISG